MADALRIPIDAARCPWCGSQLGEWSVGSSAACLASGWATRTGPDDRPTCPVDWRGGTVEQWRDGLYLRLDDPRDVVAWQMRRSLDIAEMQGEQGRDVITQLQVGIIIARAEAEVACRHVELARVDLSIAEGGRDDAADDVERLVYAARQSRALLRACILVGIIQVFVGLALAACWPSDPPALAQVALVLGGCAAVVVGGWPAVRRTWTTGAADAARGE